MNQYHTYRKYKNVFSSIQSLVKHIELIRLNIFYRENSQLLSYLFRTFFTIYLYLFYVYVDWIRADDLLIHLQY